MSKLQGNKRSTPVPRETKARRQGNSFTSSFFRDDPFSRPGAPRRQAGRGTARRRETISHRVKTIALGPLHFVLALVSGPAHCPLGIRNEGSRHSRFDPFLCPSCHGRGNSSWGGAETSFYCGGRWATPCIEKSRVVERKSNSLYGSPVVSVYEVLGTE